MKKDHKLPLSMVLSGGVLLIIILATLLATLSPYDPIAVETGQKFLPPSAQHLLGTDNFGRDTFTRLLYGGRVSLLVGFLSMLISIIPLVKMIARLSNADQRKAFRESLHKLRSEVVALKLKD